MSIATKKNQRVIPRYVRKKVRHSLMHLLLLLCFLALIVGIYKGGVQLVELKAENIRIQDLPLALTLSFFRMSAAYFISLILAYFLGLAAARTETGEKIILPVLDILQSVPVIGFFPAAISFFIGISNGHRIGVEMAAVFLIFTSQAWNMAFAVYEATKTIPQDNFDAITSFGLKGSQKFWKLYAPASIPRLVYNSILSWSNGWYFLVACEIIAVGPMKFYLPGIGSFLSLAAEQDHIHLVFWGILALTLLILGLDYFIWRPISIWSDRFKQDYSTTADANETGTISNIFDNIHQSHAIFRHSRFLRAASFFQTAKSSIQTTHSHLSRSMTGMIKVLISPLVWIAKEIALPLLWDLPASIAGSIGREFYLRFAVPALDLWNRALKRVQWLKLLIMWFVGVTLGLWAGMALVRWLRPPWPELASEIPLAILASTIRLVVTLLISFSWVLPVIYYSWNKPRFRQGLTTVAQVGASLPAIALFPLFIILITKKMGGGMELASILLLITGMQWYILFNCLGGAAIIPNDLIEATRALGLTRRQTWKHLVLPAIRPAIITGAITAWGGGWNALVVSEYVAYKNQVLTVNGIGALLNRAVYQLGDNRAISLCIAAMVAWIILINALVWRPLYRTAAERYKFDS